MLHTFLKIQNKISILIIFLFLTLIFFSCSAQNRVCLGCVKYYSSNININDRGQTSFQGDSKDQINSKLLSTYYVIHENSKNEVESYYYIENNKLHSIYKINYKYNRISSIEQKLKQISKTIIYKFNYSYGKISKISMIESDYKREFEFYYNNVGDRLIIISDKLKNYDKIIFNKINYFLSDEINIMNLYNSIDKNIKNRKDFYNNIDEDILKTIEEKFITLENEMQYNIYSIFNLERGYFELYSKSNIETAIQFFNTAFNIFDFEHNDYDGKILFYNFENIKKYLENQLQIPQIKFVEKKRIQYENLLSKYVEIVEYLNKNILNK